MSYTNIKPGEEIEISSHIYHGEGGTSVAELVSLSMEELDRMEQASMDREQAIFNAMCELEPQWRKQAGETRRIREAKAYLRTKPVEHTANQWITDQYNYHKMSNMVYKMTWRVYERTERDWKLQKQVVTGWELSWSVWFNTIQNPDNTRTGLQIAGQDRKVFKDKAAMDKYLQGRINAYAHLFTEISPPIPKGEEGRFSVNGVLLPGYTVEVPEPTPQERVDALMKFLDDGDTLPDTPAKPEPPKTSKASRPAHKPKKHTPTR